MVKSVCLMTRAGSVPVTDAMSMTTLLLALWYSSFEAASVTSPMLRISPARMVNVRLALNV